VHPARLPARLGIENCRDSDFTSNVGCVIYYRRTGVNSKFLVTGYRRLLRYVSCYINEYLNSYTKPPLTPACAVKLHSGFKAQNSSREVESVASWQLRENWLSTDIGDRFQVYYLGQPITQTNSAWPSLCGQARFLSSDDGHD